MDEQYRQADQRSNLELHFPHIIDRLLEAWPDIDDANRFLNTILVDDRDNRSGLPEEAFAELIFLSDVNWKRGHFNEDGLQVTPDSFSFGKPF